MSGVVPLSFLVMGWFGTSAERTIESLSERNMTFMTQFEATGFSSLDFNILFVAATLPVIANFAALFTLKRNYRYSMILSSAQWMAKRLVLLLSKRHNCSTNHFAYDSTYEASNFKRYVHTIFSETIFKLCWTQ